MSEVMGARLITGEYIIGLVDRSKRNEPRVSMEQPMTFELFPHPQKKGQLGIVMKQMKPLSAGTTYSLEMKQDHIMFWMDDLHEAILEHYSKASGTNVIVPAQKMPPSGPVQLVK